MATLQHLGWEDLAARPSLAMEQVSLAHLMAFTELMQVSFFCLFALWRVLWAGLSLQLQVPCLLRSLLLTVMSSKTGPC